MQARADYPERHPGYSSNLASAEYVSKIRDIGSRIAHKKGRRVKLMEVCGTHTVALARTGITEALSDVIELISGPGCPVCVTHQEDLNRMIGIGQMDDVIVATFGDLLRVPGYRTSLEKERAKGAFIHICYSPMEALEAAKSHSTAQVVFLGVGFETTAPAIAALVIQAKRERLDNLSVYSAVKVLPPALRALLGRGNTGLDGLILPGHVSTLIGKKAFDFLAWEYGIPSVVTGFGDVDLLLGLSTLLNLVNAGRSLTVNAYAHVAKESGNPEAMRMLSRCFEEGDTLWRGFGLIPGSGLELRAEYAAHDAKRRLGMPLQPVQSAEGHDHLCRCGDIIVGQMSPLDCSFFDNGCDPLSPMGPCMVSSEGACSAYYHYRDRRHSHNRGEVPQ
ncbi:MAG: hydrogenase formation protein HypD [Bacillota bacterium]|jgi:hydrogenase expression/formation protein HypD